MLNNEDQHVNVALAQIAAVENFAGSKAIPKALAAARERHLEMQRGPASVLDRVAGQLADSSKTLTAESLASAADEVIAARAAELQREMVSRELIGAAASLTGSRLYADFKAAIPTLWGAVDLRAQDSFKLINENAHKVPSSYSNEVAFDDPDQDRQNAWRLLKGAANAIATAHGIRQQWRQYRFLSICQYDTGDQYGLVQNFGTIGGSVPGRLPDGGQTSVEWLTAAVRAGGQLWLPLSGVQDRAFLGDNPQQAAG